MIRIGTRESKLAVWQAELVQQVLQQHGYSTELVLIKSEGDIDLTTPLYAMGVQGVFTRSLDIALLENRIDIAVHSMKDVPTQLPAGIVQAAVLPRGPVKDLIVFKNDDTRALYESLKNAGPENDIGFTVATSSIRRKAQWLNRFGAKEICNLRGNVITRLQKLQTEPWHAAIFAQAGLERIGVRPENSFEIDWMLPAPAQGAIMVVAKEDDHRSLKACTYLNDEATAACTQVERDFLKTLLGGCSTPISALAIFENDTVQFAGNILSVDGRQSATVERTFSKSEFSSAGRHAAIELLQNGGEKIASEIRNAK